MCRKILEFLPICTFVILSTSVGAEPATGVRAFVNTDVNINPELFCFGYEEDTEPVLGECPKGTYGIASCIQNYKIPKKLEIYSVAPNLAYECILDIDNRTPDGPPYCDYRRCLEEKKAPKYYDILLDGVWVNDFIWD